MKSISTRHGIWLSIAILVGAAAWHQQRTLSAARAELRTTRATVERLTHPEHYRARHRERAAETSPPAGRALAAEVIEAFSARADASGSTPGSARAFEDLVIRLESLSLPQIRALLDEVKTRGELGPEEMGNLVRVILENLTASRPQDAVMLSIEWPAPAPAHFPEEMAAEFSRQSAARAMNAWAREDPAAALQWVRERMAAGDEVDNSMRYAVIRHTAGVDRKLAFELIAELRMPRPHEVTQPIVGSARTADERIAAVEHLRVYLAGLQDAGVLKRCRSYGLATLGRDIAKEGVSAARALVEGAGLNGTEIGDFASEIPNDAPPGTEKEWAEWLRETVPTERISKPMRDIVRRWAAADYQEVGNWLNTVGPGAARNAAVAAYAEQLALYEPEAAAGWAVTLPEGEQRTATLRTIHRRWKEGFPEAEAAAQAFAEEHGISR